MSTPANTEQPNLLQRRQWVAGTVASLAGGSFSLYAADASAQQPLSPHREGIYPRKETTPKNVGYAPGHLARGSQVLFISGQWPTDLQADMETQIRQTMDRIGQILQAADATFANVTILRGYFVHLQRDLPIFRKVRLDYLGTPAPAITSVGVTELAIANLEIEIEAIAIL